MNRAFETLRRLDPVDPDGPGASSHSHEARQLLDSILRTEPGPRAAAPPHRAFPRLATLALIAVVATPAGYGLWRAFGPLVSGPGPGPSRPAATVASPTGNGGTPAQAEQRYETTATVLEPRDGPPMLCLGGVLTSLPPQCGTMPITNWDWGRVEGEQRASGVTWGEYQVVGTYDGSSFTVLDVGPPRAQPPDPIESIVIPCPEPAGGWKAADPNRTSRGDLDAAIHAAAAQPDSAGAWLKYLVPPAEDGSSGPNDLVLNAAFTGDVERHRQELAQLWGGPLCVVRYERPESELRHIQSELTDPGPAEFGYTLLFASTDIVRNRVEVGVVVADDRLQAAIDARFGPGVVRLVPALRPVG